MDTAATLPANAADTSHTQSSTSFAPPSRLGQSPPLGNLESHVLKTRGLQGRMNLGP